MPAAGTGRVTTIDYPDKPTVLSNNWNIADWVDLNASIPADWTLLQRERCICRDTSQSLPVVTPASVVGRTTNLLENGVVARRKHRTATVNMP